MYVCMYVLFEGMIVCKQYSGWMYYSGCIGGYGGVFNGVVGHARIGCTVDDVGADPAMHLSTAEIQIQVPGTSTLCILGEGVSTVPSTLVDP